MPIIPTCLNITHEPVRSTIDISGYEVSTPYVKSFSIDRSRGKLSATFSASVEVPVSASFVAGSDIIIYGGLKDNETKRFTGTMKTITTQPSFDKAGYFILNMSGVDKMGELEGKTFSRRLRSDGFSMFVSIDSGPSNRPSRGMSLDKRIRGGRHTFTSTTPKPTNIEHSEITYAPKRGQDRHGSFSKATDIGPGQGAEGGALTTHDHSEISKGGPAFGVFISD